MSRFLMIFCGLLTIGCGQPVTQSPGSEKIDSLQTGIVKAHRECNSIYFWKTTFDPTKTELDFLQKYDVQRLYIRFFDVALDNSWLEEKLTVVPIATTVFAQTPPAGLEIVPTVYITLEALRSVKGKEAEYADKITTRILAMATRHKISNISEVQFDCDWTGRRRKAILNYVGLRKILCIGEVSD